MEVWQGEMVGRIPVMDSWPNTALWLFIPKAEVGPLLKTKLIWDKRKFIEIQRKDWNFD
jgi:hypothetical protein